MAIDFPGSPSTGQRHSHNNTTWEWDGSSWNRITIDLSTTDAATLSGIAATQFARRDDDNIITGVTTFIGNGYTGVGNTVLIVEGDARVTGVLSVGQGSLSINERDIYAAGVVTATTFVGALTGNVTGNVSGSAGSATGNAATATALQNARTIGGVSFDGTSNINLPGVNATGNQDTSGNAATSGKLQNARTIGGVSFDGSANINLPGVNAAGNQNTTGTAALAEGLTGTPDITVRNVTVTGIQTAEDVKNIDSVGIITARTGIDVTGGTFKADGLVGAAGSVLSTTGSGIHWVSPLTGPQGAQGRQGADGAQGAAGVAGAQGHQGVQGTAGSSGGTGPQGVQGAQGRQGAQGVQGAAGAQGAQGRQGATGAAGAQGSQGYQGVQGSVGIASLTISTGAPSSPAAGDMWWDSDDSDLHIYFNDGSSSQWVNINSGTAGVQGATGAQGAQGVQGAQGHQGVQGAQGHQGVQGATGAAGAQGAQGAAGSNGAAGAQGAQGHQGVQGATGPAPTSGGANFTSEVDISDGTFLDFGNGGLKIRTNGNNAYITEGTSGKLAIQGSNIEIANSDGDETYIYCTDDGTVQLYHNNVNTFLTGTHGIFVKAPEGGSGQLYIHADEGDDDADQWGLIASHTSSKFSIDNYASGSWETSLTCEGNGAVKLFHDNQERLTSTTTGITVKHTGADHAWIGMQSSAGICGYLIGQSNAGTGSEKAISLYNAAGNEAHLQAIQDKGVLIYYDNVKKFETTSSGVSVTGAITASQGGTITGNTQFNGAVDIGDDNGSNYHRVRLGASQDLSLWHDATNSYISNTTGDLFIQTAASKAVYIRPNNGANGIICHPGGAVDLYHNANKKLGTTADGIEVTGKIFPSSHIDMADNVILKIGTGDDLEIWHNSTNSLIQNTTGNLIIKDTSGSIYLQSTQVVIQDDTTNENIAKFISDGACELYHDNVKKFETKSNGVAVAGQVDCTAGGVLVDDNYSFSAGTGGDVLLYHNGSNSYLSNSTGNLMITGNNSDKIHIRAHASKQEIVCFPSGAVQLYHNDSLKFETTSDGIDVTGGINLTGEFNMTGNGAKYLDFFTLANSNSITFRHHNPSGNAFETAAYFVANGGAFLTHNGVTRLSTTSAGITVSGEVDATSDIKLKENIKTIENSLDKVLQLRGVEFDWKETKDSSIGLIAQEVEEVLPELVHETDDIKSVSYGNITAVLIEAIKEQNKIINTMKKEIEELKG